MNPALFVAPEPELASPIRDNHGVAQQILLAQAAPQGRLSGDIDRIWRDGEFVEAQRLQMGAPRGFVGKTPGWMIGQLGNLRRRHIHRVHFGQRRVVDDVIGAPCLQRQYEGAAGLRLRGPEDREPIVAGLRHERVLARMAPRRVVDADPARGIEAGAQHGLVFDHQGLQSLAEQTHHLPLGDMQTHAVQ